MKDNTMTKTPQNKPMMLGNASAFLGVSSATLSMMRKIDSLYFPSPEIRPDSFKCAWNESQIAAWIYFMENKTAPARKTLGLSPEHAIVCKGLITGAQLLQAIGHKVDRRKLHEVMPPIQWQGSAAQLIRRWRIEDIQAARRPEFAEKLGIKARTPGPNIGGKVGNALSKGGLPPSSEPHNVPAGSLVTDAAVIDISRSRKPVIVVMGRREAEELSNAISDHLCWANGFRAATPADDRGNISPMAVAELRELNINIKRLLRGE